MLALPPASTHLLPCLALKRSLLSRLSCLLLNNSQRPPIRITQSRFFCASNSLLPASFWQRGRFCGLLNLGLVSRTSGQRFANVLENGGCSLASNAESLKDGAWVLGAGCWDVRNGRRFVCTEEDEPRWSMKRKPGKIRTVYVCEQCGKSEAQWWGSCPACNEGQLRKFSEFVYPTAPGGGAGARAAEGLCVSTRKPLGVLDEMSKEERTSARPRTWLASINATGPRRLSDVSNEMSQDYWRLPLSGETGIEVARVLGGGLVPGSLVLVGGDPGVGKSTLLLQIAGIIADGCATYKPTPVLYVSGEESVEQISSRADRIKISSHELFLYSATDLEIILDSVDKLSPRAVIIDSIQTVYLSEATGSAGSVNQVRECAAALLRSAKTTQIPIFLIGHVTKAGEIAGPRLLEHIVDVVLYMEGESRQSHRLLRVVKNRFGSTDEVGVFEMVEGGLVAVQNPSQLFLSIRTANLENSTTAAVAVTMQGSRPFLVEIQALCLPSTSTHFRHLLNGVESSRVHLVLAVLIKHAGLNLHAQDVFVNVVGGMQIREPAADLAIAIAISSSFLDRQIPSDMAFVGEVGLAGEIRSVGQLEKRVIEVGKLGFQRCIVPVSATKALRGLTAQGVEIIPCDTIKDAISKIL